jgi:tRNA-modifying protein YgfZ
MSAPSFLEWAAAAGATIGGRGVQHFGDPKREYREARSGVVLFDRSTHGRLGITGADALDVLHRTTSGDLKALKPGGGGLTVIQTETARILDWVTLWVLDDQIVAVTGEDRGAKVRDWIDRMVIMEDVAVTDVTGETELLELHGPGAARTASTLAGVEVEGLPPQHHVAFEWNGMAGRLARGRAGTSSFQVMVGPRQAGGLAEALSGAGLAVPAGSLASEALRIEDGQPLSGRELTEETNPLEAGLDDSIGFTKGCYPGQEVIARMITYKSLKRTLAGFVFEEPGSEPAVRHSFPVRHRTDDRLAGRLTSFAFSYGLEQYVGLGIVPLELAKPDTPVLVDTGTALVRARTVPLPMTGGSDSGKSL